jgi:threonine dehydrogenase-like Zn-dependent dehydrogenase
MEIIASKKAIIKNLYSHTFKLEELPEAFNNITNGKVERYLKGMVIP